MTLEKRVVMPHLQNTVHVNYRLISGRDPVRIELRPALHFRPHEGLVSVPPTEPYTLVIVEDRYEIIGGRITRRCGCVCSARALR